MGDVEVVPTGGACGAEIRGVDLSRPLSEAQASRIVRALLDHCVIFFRGQEISEADQVRFTRIFGRPVPHVREQADRPIKEIFIISNVTEDGKPIGALGNDEIQFHSDLSYMPEPGTVSILYAIEVPDTGGDTMWVNLYRAYEELDEGLKGRVEDLRAVHRHPRPQQNPPTPAVHPVIRTHPETGRRLIYVSPHLTSHIDGVSEAESRELLDKLVSHATQPKYVWRHRWRVGDLLVWDNRCTMHRRESFPNDQRRVMKRTQIFGEAVC